MAVILGWDILTPSIMRADVPHLFLMDPSLATIAVPDWIDL